MANINDERFLRLRNGKFVKGIKANGEETNLFKINSSDKFEFVENPEVGGSPLQTESQVVTKIQVAEQALQSEIEIVESGLAQEILNRQAGDASTLTSAQSYTDSKVAEAKLEILGGIDDATLDTIKEVADRLKDEEEVSSIILTSLGDKQNQIDALVSDVAGKVSKSGDTMSGNLNFGQVPTIYGNIPYAFSAEVDSVIVKSGNDVLATWQPQTLSWELNPAFTSFENPVGPAGDWQFSFNSTQNFGTLTVEYYANGAGEVFTFSYPVGSGFYSLSPQNAIVVQGVSGHKITGLAEGTEFNDAVNLGQLNSAVDSLSSGISLLTTDLANEVYNRIAGDESAILESKEYTDIVASGINSDIEGIEAALAQELIDRASGDQTTLDSAKAYADGLASGITTDIGALEAGLAQELLDRAAGDLALEGQIQAEESARVLADSALESRIEVLEAKIDGPYFGKVKRILSTVLTYIDLDHVAISGSINLVMKRTPMFEGEDYDLSVVNGVSRLTFKGDFASTGAFAPEVDDVLNCNYAYIP
jgi:hypothetical protein